MKPSSEDPRLRRLFREQRQAFPLTDCNYQAYSFHRYYRGPERNPNASFLNISREYFRCEARRGFLAEAAYFLVLVAVLALTFVIGTVLVVQALNLAEG